MKNHYGEAELIDLGPGGAGALSFTFDEPPAVTARLLCHRLNLPWQHVEAIEDVLSMRMVSILARTFNDQLGACTQADVLIWDLFRRCHSPIEEVFLASLFRVSRAHHSFRWDIDETTGKVGSFTKSGATLWAQRRVAGFRIDFCIEAPAVLLCIELDGHDFHERTKHQAQRDKSRDRAILASGGSVARFTGSELWRDPVTCAKEALKLAGMETTE